MSSNSITYVDDSNDYESFQYEINSITYEDEIDICSVIYLEENDIDYNTEYVNKSSIVYCD